MNIIDPWVSRYFFPSDLFDSFLKSFSFSNEPPIFWGSLIETILVLVHLLFAFRYAKFLLRDEGP